VEEQRWESRLIRKSGDIQARTTSGDMMRRW
jgi:hypothetical protein